MPNRRCNAVAMTARCKAAAFVSRDCGWQTHRRIDGTSNMASCFVCTGHGQTACIAENWDAWVPQRHARHCLSIYAAGMST